MPAGSGALAGLNWDLDREALAAELGFARPHPNSLDAVSNRDFALDYLYAASACAMHLSRLGSRSCSGRARSSASASPPIRSPRARASCPRRRTPTPPSCCAARRRGSPPRSTACWARCTRCHSPTARTCRRTRSRSSTPSTTSSSASRRRPRCSPAWASTGERLEAAASDEMLAATDIADLLVREGVPFREAHGMVAGLVREAVEQRKRLSELEPSELSGASRRVGEVRHGAARLRRLDRVEGLGRRHLLGARRRAARGRARRARAAQPELETGLERKRLPAAQ